MLSKRKDDTHFPCPRYICGCRVKSHLVFTNLYICREFKRLRVIVSGLHNQYNANLADMQKLKEKNDGIRFLLIIIDVFSIQLWIEPLLNKTEDSVIEAFQHIFQRTSKPHHLRTYGGGEFKGQKVEDYFDSINVEHWSAHNDQMKANYAEYVTQTLKSSLWNYMRKVKRYRYVGDTWYTLP